MSIKYALPIDINCIHMQKQLLGNRKNKNRSFYYRYTLFSSLNRVNDYHVMILANYKNYKL